MKILVLDDDKAVLASMQIQLQKRFSKDDQFWFCSDYDAYCENLHDIAFDVLLLDILMPVSVISALGPSSLRRKCR